LKNKTKNGFNDNDVAVDGKIGLIIKKHIKTPNAFLGFDFITRVILKEKKE